MSTHTIVYIKTKLYTRKNNLSINISFYNCSSLALLGILSIHLLQLLLILCHRQFTFAKNMRLLFQTYIRHFVWFLPKK